VEGYRLDVSHAIVNDRDLLDNPPSDESDPLQVQMFGQKRVYSANRPEVHQVLKRWRKVAKDYEYERLLLGETYVWDLDSLVAFYGKRNDEIQLAMNIPFVHANFDAHEMSAIVGNMESGLPRFGWPVWMGSNHDATRFATRWCDNDERKIRCALMLLLTLRGTPLLGYGDEIGLPNIEITEEQLRDPVGVRFWPHYKGRDPGRSPMQWSWEQGAGFSAPGVEPWLPYGDFSACNVADQYKDESSVLYLCRDLIALRKDRADLRSGEYRKLTSPDGTWIYKRGKKTTIAVNMSEEPVKVSKMKGTVVLSTSRDRDGQPSSATLELSPWEGVVVSS
jgi:alpha-glucosidase